MPVSTRVNRAISSFSFLIGKDRQPDSCSDPGRAYDGFQIILECSAMAMNRIQFQHGLSMPEFFNLYGSERSARRPWRRRAGRVAFAARTAMEWRTVFCGAGPSRFFNATPVGIKLKKWSRLFEQRFPKNHRPRRAGSSAVFCNNFSSTAFTKNQPPSYSPRTAPPQPSDPPVPAKRRSATPQTRPRRPVRPPPATPATRCAALRRSRRR